MGVDGCDVSAGCDPGVGTGGPPALQLAGSPWGYFTSQSLAFFLYKMIMTTHFAGLRGLQEMDTLQ